MNNTAENMKQCSTCKEMRPLSMFHKDSSKACGVRAMYSICRNPKVQEYYYSDLGQKTAQKDTKKKRIRRDNDKVYAEKRRSIVNKSSERPEYRENLRRKASTPHGREKKRATNAVEAALKRGDLIRPDKCQECGDAPGTDRIGRSKVRAYHHLGYAKEHRLDVRWLCPRCLNRIIIDMDTMLDR